MRRSFRVLVLFCCLATAFAQESQEAVSVAEETMQKLLIHSVKPIPPAEPGMRLEGKVVLNAIINKTGGVERLEMESGHPMLVPAALEAVRQWRYRPYKLNGIPRAVETTIHVEFSKESDIRNETAAAVESPILVTPEDMPAQLVYRVAPIYPPLARQARIQGIVILRIIINKVGEVRETQLVSGHPMLAPAAVEAVKKWTYIPYESGGKTVEVQTEVEVVFKLAGA
jgi:TonB family protein